jgi:hypothetical protein
MSEQIAIDERLREFAPGSILAIGPRAEALTEEYLRAHPQCRLERIDAGEPMSGDALLGALAELAARRGRFDFAVVRGVLETLDREAGGALVAALRDRYAKRFCVVVAEPRQDGGAWTANDLRALGLAQWAQQPTPDAVLRAFGYDVATYKETPDWLNARHWAHPELWDKYRW